MRSYLGLYLALLLLCLRGSSAQVPQAEVTFFSHGSTLTSGVPGTKHDLYNGGIFDGARFLFTFRDGFFLHNNRFLTVRLDAGPHVFGASNAKKPEDRETLHVDLLANMHYYIRAQGDLKGIPVVFEIQHGRLDLVPCEDAQDEAGRGKRLGEKAFGKYLKDNLSRVNGNESSLPPCS